MNTPQEEGTRQSTFAANVVCFIIAFVILIIMSFYFFLCQDGHRKVKNDKEEIYILKDEVVDTGVKGF